MKEKKHPQLPLDMEESEEGREMADIRKNRIWFYLEWIPISLLSIGFLLRQQGNYLWKYLLIGGGISAILIYLLFSSSLLQAKKNSRLEMTLSLLSGLLLSFGVLSLIGKFLFWDNAEIWLRYTLYGGFAMLTLVSFAFLFHIRQSKATNFYRDLIARLLIFIALVYNLGF